MSWMGVLLQALVPQEVDFLQSLHRQGPMGYHWVHWEGGHSCHLVVVHCHYLRLHYRHPCLVHLHYFFLVCLQVQRAVCLPYHCW